RGFELPIVRRSPAVQGRSPTLTNLTLDRRRGERTQQKAMSTIARGTNPPRGVDPDIHRSKLEPNLDAMSSCACQLVDHDPISSLHENHPAPMANGIGKHAVTVMLGFCRSERFIRKPLEQLRRRATLPGKRPPGLILIVPVYHYGAVRRSAYEVVGQLMLLLGTWFCIDEIGLPERGTLEAQ